MSNFVFTSFTKENRPLSAELWRRGSALLLPVRGAASLADLDQVPNLSTANAISLLNLDAPELGRMRIASDTEGDTRWDADRTVGKPTRRYFVSLEVRGDIELVRFWPDGTGAHLDAVDHSVVQALGGLNAAGKASWEEVRRYHEAGSLWQIGADTSPLDGGPVAFSLYTYFDLTREEEVEVERGDLDVRSLASERRDLISPIVEAIAVQVRSFVEVELPAEVQSRLDERRRELQSRAAVRDSLSFPEEWHASEPQLDVATLEEILPPVTDSADPVEMPSTLQDYVVDARSRLSKASFEDVVYSLRHWANAVERYPSAFGVLSEDRLSDLLAATWNATLPGAARVVYSRGGKSDIFIQADVLDPGRGPGTVFVCESKWATSHKVIKEALDPQLFGYLNVHDTSAVLLVLMRQKNFSRARADYLAVLESVAGHKRTTDGPTENWPLLQFARDGRIVTVCVAFVHLPTRA